MEINRRRFLARSARFAGAGLIAPYISAEAAARSAGQSKNDRPGIGAIGMRYQGTVITLIAQTHGDVVAIADVDRHVREQARAGFGSTPRMDTRCSWFPVLNLPMAKWVSAL